MSCSKQDIVLNIALSILQWIKQARINGASAADCNSLINLTNKRNKCDVILAIKHMYTQITFWLPTL